MRMSQKQEMALNFIRNNPGCKIADVARYRGYMYSPNPGHAAEYARVNRLIRRGIVIWSNGGLQANA